MKNDKKNTQRIYTMMDGLNNWDVANDWGGMDDWSVYNFGNWSRVHNMSKTKIYDYHFFLSSLLRFGKKNCEPQN